MKIGLFYGSTTCYTEIAAEKIQEICGTELLTLHNIKDVSLDEVKHYDFLIFGISTWDYGELQEDWESNWDDIDKVDLASKTIALYGMGDQVGYTEWFQDALGMLHHKIAPQGVNFIGYWPNDNTYEFEESKALTEDGTQFLGLALDEDSQYELSENRIANWVEQILLEFQASI